jgi:hypothetical protein
MNEFLRPLIDIAVYTAIFFVALVIAASSYKLTRGKK